MSRFSIDVYEPTVPTYSYMYTLYAHSLHRSGPIKNTLKPISCTTFQNHFPPSFHSPRTPSHIHGHASPTAPHCAPTHHKDVTSPARSSPALARAPSFHWTCVSLRLQKHGARCHGVCVTLLARWTLYTPRLLHGGSSGFVDVYGADSNGWCAFWFGRLSQRV